MNRYFVLVAMASAQSPANQGFDVALWITLIGLGAMVLIFIFIIRSMIKNQSNEEDLEIRCVHYAANITTTDTQSTVSDELPPPYS
jgi:hypothetical protein